jgi:hypothetical protein
MIMDQPTHLYRHYDKAGSLLYVGISLNALGRLAAHRKDSSWFFEIARVEIEVFPNRAAALEAECATIKEHKPPYNTMFNRPQYTEPGGPVHQNDRMYEARLRKEAQGLRQVLVWVPAERVEELRRIAENMRKEMDDETHR